MRRTTGHYVTTSVGDERVRAFVPEPLPPSPAIKMDTNFNNLLAEASLELEKLNVASALVQSPEWFIYGFVRREAVLSSRIEGTQASLSDLISYEAGVLTEEKAPDVREVCNYLDALNLARKELARPQGLPLSLRLIRSAHKKLLTGVRGADRQPGRFRRSQNWVGGTRPGNAVFVPPPPDQMPACLDALEKYLHDENNISPLVRAGLIHVQFETIHPFLDGNGRVGRLLITLLLEQWGLLDKPLLYLSLFFMRHRQEYYNRLSAVRTDGDWEGWTGFFLEGISTTAREATSLASALFSLFEHDREKVLESPASSVAALRLFEKLPAKPLLTIALAVEILEISKPTAIKAVSLLAELGILHELTGRKRNRVYSYSRYLEMLGRDME